MSSRQIRQYLAILLHWQVNKQQNLNSNGGILGTFEIDLVNHSKRLVYWKNETFKPTIYKSSMIWLQIWFLFWESYKLWKEDDYLNIESMVFILGKHSILFDCGKKRLSIKYSCFVFHLPLIRNEWKLPGFDFGKMKKKMPVWFWSIFW